MKRLTKLGFMILSILTIYSCSKDDTTNINPTIIENTVEAGEWKVTKFSVSGTDESSDFSNYELTFDSNGDVKAVNDTSIYNGNWSVTDSQSSGNLIEDLDFNLLFNSSSFFEKITANWDVLSRADAKIELVYFGNKSEGTRFLTIEKK